MINSTINEKLLNAVNFANEDERDNINRIKEGIVKSQQRGIVYDFFSKDTLNRGLYNFVVEKNINELKQWFYVSSLLRAESCKYSGGYSMSTPDGFIFPILSDNREVIEKFAYLNKVNLLWGEFEPSYQAAKFKPSNNDPRFRTHALQAVLRHDWQDYEQIKDVAYQNIHKLREVVQFEFNVYDAISAKDKDKIIEIVQTLLKPKVHKAYNKDFTEEFSGEIWSHHPVMFTKLAWMNGLEIEIDNPLVPMELMPIRPLAHYDYHYDFLDPNWRPKSFLERLFGKRK